MPVVEVPVPRRPETLELGDRAEPFERRNPLQIAGPAGAYGSARDDDSDPLNGGPVVREAQATGGGIEIVAEDLPVSAPGLHGVGCLDFDLERSERRTADAGFRPGCPWTVRLRGLV